MMNNTASGFESVLCIDDDDEYNFLTQEAFSDFKYAGRLRFMNHAEDALDYLENAPRFPDIIILDINMPVMNGWDFLDEFEARGYHEQHNTLIFLHSSSVFDSDKERAVKYACVKGFIDKPLELKDLKMISQDYFK